MNNTWYLNKLPKDAKYILTLFLIISEGNIKDDNSSMNIMDFMYQYVEDEIKRKRVSEN